MKILNLLNPMPFPPDQEKQFRQQIETHFRSFLWIPVGLILLMQLFNIGFVLHYNNFSTLTRASLVYLCFYIFLLVFSVALLPFLIRKKQRVGLLMQMQTLYVLCLLLWGACVTIYDQRVSTNISVYLVIGMSVAVLSYLPPLLSVSAFTAAQILLLVGIPIFSGPEGNDFYGRFLNLFIVNIMAAFISCYRYHVLRTDFQNNWIISEQNREIREKNTELDYWAHHDSMTGLSNQRFLTACVRKIISQADNPVAVCMMDIDDFKSYNDHFGHIRGDECLVRIAKAMELQITEGNLFRYGGEEFLLLLPQADEARALETAARLRAAVDALKIPAPGPGTSVTISAGFACSPIFSEEDWEKLINKADSALYQAKNGGKNQLVRFQI